MNRALTPDQKREVVERLLRAWLKAPTERLGQLIVNALPHKLQGDPFYVEDFDLVEAIELKVKDK